MSDAKPRIEIDVVSDVVCPWCFVGKRRLEAALALAPDVDVGVHWRPYQLDATIPPEGISRTDYLTRKFGPDKASQMHARLESVGQEVGIPFAFDRIARSPNTLNAHRLIRWAGELGEDVQGKVKERLQTLYFLEGGDIGDLDTLASAAQACGMDGAETRRKLATDEDVDMVRADIESAQRMGVNGVPFFIIDGKYGVSGAQAPETIVEAIRHALKER
ncbi:MAG: disulfide bond formation protein DsbA [Hyphomicrobiales bacterium]|nr:disulfide bond formation protein DsbA [Hyphomicrobiales bacterium]